MTGKIFWCATCGKSQTDRFGKVCAACVAAAVTTFLRTDEDLRLALAHIFEGDGPELERDIKQAVMDDMQRQYDVRLAELQVG